ncbi:hypothetical protein [Terrabacter sp. BE26]|uniref:hypothetical protein n=1 Tax=Terrabacter sp. BE26 TaxID=2898152 RepID=UPI0035BE4D0C
MSTYLTAPLGEMVSSYRCRAHLEEPVTWRGKGCAACAEEAVARSQRPKKKWRPENAE